MNKEYHILKRRMLIQDLLLLVLLGAMLNMSVIVFNDGKMPVFMKATESIPQGLEDSYLVIEDKEDINYYYLGDILYIKSLKFSIGDVLMVFGIFGILIMLTQGIFIKLKRRINNGTFINIRK